MKSILFTKKGIEQEVCNVLNTDYAIDFIDFIKIDFLPIPAFNLEKNGLIFTSVNAVEGFLKNNFQAQNNIIYCVGSKTEKALIKSGLKPHYTAKNAEELAYYIINHKEHPQRCVHFCGQMPLRIIGDILLDYGIDYEQAIVYFTQLIEPKLSKNYDAIVFFSPSGVKSFLAFNDFKKSVLFSIGSTTESFLDQYATSPIICANHTLKDLLQKIKEYYTQ